MTPHRHPEPAILSRTIDTADGPFTIVVDIHGAVVASGWVGNADDALIRVNRASIGKVLLGTHEGPDGQRLATVDGARMRRGLDDATYAVTDYYAGQLGAPLAIPVSQFGTSFQVTGWRALRTLEPSASPITYAEFAHRAGNPAAVRAAASVCARNAAGLFVPCHRVVRADGEPGNFAWGVETKRSLLARESHH